jgi:hypothetical protein
MLKIQSAAVVLTTTILVSVIGLSGIGAKRSVENYQEAEDQTAWVSRSLKQMQTVKVGMTRADLLKVFTTEGGLSTRLWRTYVYKQCPYFKVDVEFRAVGTRDKRGRVGIDESDDDVITKISKPYLAWTVAD